MAKYRVDYAAECPFYKGHEKKVIHCEGVTDTSTIQLAFPGSMTDYKNRYCCKTWENCLIAKALWSKYD